MKIMRRHRLAIILVFLFLFSSLSVIEFESKESQSLETPAFAQESDEDFTKEVTMLQQGNGGSLSDTRKA